MYGVPLVLVAEITKYDSVLNHVPVKIKKRTSVILTGPILFIFARTSSFMVSDKIQAVKMY